MVATRNPSANGRAHAAALEAALAYAARGWAVLPLHNPCDGGRRCSCADPDCASVGKHPRTAAGVKEATTKEATIRAWWKRWPQANVGIACGPASGLWMLGPDGHAGLEEIARWEGEHGPLPDTLRTASGGGGEHYLFRWPYVGLIGNRANHRGLPIDTRGEGGYFVAPPSMHRSGKPYSWLSGPDGDPAEAPDWLLEWAQKSQPRALPTLRAAGPRDDAGDTASRASAYLKNCDPSVSGRGGHAALFWAARAMVYGFDLPPGDALDLLASEFNPRCVPPWSEKELRHKVEQADAVPYDKPRGWLLTAERPDRAPTASPPPASAPPAGYSDLESMELPEPEVWPELRGEALHGPAGEFVRLVGPQSEADPVALLSQLHVCVGNAVGNSPHFNVEGTRHHCNENLAVVGQSSHGRKGTSYGRTRQVMLQAARRWVEGHVVDGGLSSGEGLIYHVRDAVLKTGKGQPKELDPGVSDKRLLVVEGEFAQVLRVLRREGNTLSAVLRNAFDGLPLRTLVRNSPLRATGAHISIIGHITRHELAGQLGEVEVFNGFSNRFLWVLSRRSKFLPDGGEPVDLQRLGTRLRDAIDFAQTVGGMGRSPQATGLWRELYPRLEAERGGPYGAATGRAAAHVLRLSMIYALLDKSDTIGVEHLRAAAALWDYADASAKLIFGAEAEDPLVARVGGMIDEAPGGLTRTQINNALGRNVPARRLVRALATLRDKGRARPDKPKTDGPGRPPEVWHRVRPD